MTDEASRAYEAAAAHYLRGETMDTIARRMAVSRSTVSRLLAAARESGMVQVTVLPPSRDSVFGQRLAAEFGITVHVAEVATSATATERLSRVCQLAGALVTSALRERPEQVLGLAWGTTISEMVRHVVPDPTAEPTIVQMNGSANHRTFGIPYTVGILSLAAERLGGQLVEFPVPAFFDREEAKELLWQERSIQRVLRLLDQIDVACFGVGSFGGPLASHVYAANYLSDEEMAALKAAGVVGDVCTVMIRGDGTWRDLDINRRTSGLNPDQLARIGRRMCIVGTPDKAQALLGALRAGIVTDLVIDEQSASTAWRLLTKRR